MRAGLSLTDRTLRALKREGGRASAEMLGRATGRGLRVNAALQTLRKKGLIRKTDERDGRSFIWELVE